MQRIAFQLRIKPGSETAYDEAHRQVWPSLLAELQALGVHEYSIFRRGSELFLYMLVANFQALLEGLAKSDIDRRWQEMMVPLMEKVPSIMPGEPFAMMEEVFHMRGQAERESSSGDSIEGTAHAE